MGETGIVNLGSKDDLIRKAYRNLHMKTQFNASQSLILDVPDRSLPIKHLPIEHYLRQPKRLIYAVADRKRIEVLAPTRFRFNLCPLKFMMLSVRPVVDIDVWLEPEGSLHLQSTAVQLHGIEAFNLGFELNLQGYLCPDRTLDVTQLRGKADLCIQIQLPPSLWFTPKSILETAGNALLKSILLTMKQRLEKQLIADYQTWASSKPVATSPSRLSLERV